MIASQFPIILSETANNMTSKSSEPLLTILQTSQAIVKSNEKLMRIFLYQTSSILTNLSNICHGIVSINTAYIDRSIGESVNETMARIENHTLTLKLTIEFATVMNEVGTQACSHVRECTECELCKQFVLCAEVSN